MKQINATYLLLVLIALTFTSCAQKVIGVHGQDFDSNNVMDLSEVLNAADDYDGKEVVVTGVVNGVCQMKGCWMTLENGDENIHVNFKDYGFFVPKDLAGKRVILKGELKSTTVSVDELRHLAEDAGKSKEDIAMINEPKFEHRITATGVKIIEE